MAQIKILQVIIGKSSFGGAEKFVYEYYKNMDHSQVSFDILFASFNTMVNAQDDSCFDDSRFYVLDSWDDNKQIKSFFTTIRAMCLFLKRHKCYDIIHINSGLWKFEIACILAARINKVKRIIAHSHTAKPIDEKKSVLKRIKNKCMAWLIVKLVDDCFACSEVAANHLFGDYFYSSKKGRIIKNAIDLDLYAFDDITRNQIRKNEKVKDKTVVLGHVGRLCDVKNHLFLIDVFKEYHNINRDSVLWIIGEGENRNLITKKIDEEGLNTSVRLFGVRSDVNNLMKAMDCFLLPSKYEGLSIVAVEAQASGLPIILSDCLSREHKLSDKCIFCSLNLSPRDWANNIVDLLNDNNRIDSEKIVREKGYDIKEAAIELQGVYIDMNYEKN